MYEITTDKWKEHHRCMYSLSRPENMVKLYDIHVTDKRITLSGIPPPKGFLSTEERINYCCVTLGFKHSIISEDCIHCARHHT